MVVSMDRWKGKVAIVTGASSGVGASLAEKLVEEGLQVVGFARRKERIEELAKKLQGKKGKLHAVKVDMTKEEDIVNGFKWTTDNVGPVHILVNNAGLSQESILTESSTQDWRTIIDTNVIGLSIATREAVKIMKSKNIDGHIVHINSVVGHKVPNVPGRTTIYPASKFAVTALTETLRQELNHLGLKTKITSVSPGVIATEFAQTSGFKLTPEIIQQRKARPSLEAEDVAEAVLYVLATPPHVQVHELTIKPVGEPF